MTKNAKAKLSLTAAPTFKAPVTIQIPGGGEAVVTFTFKHRTRAEFKEFVDAMNAVEVVDGAEPTKDSEVLLDIACGWDLDEPFDAASLDKMAESYMGSSQAVISAYMVELTGARAKN